MVWATERGRFLVYIGRFMIVRYNCNIVQIIDLALIAFQIPNFRLVYNSIYNSIQPLAR